MVWTHRWEQVHCVAPVPGAVCVSLFAWRAWLCRVGVDDTFAAFNVGLKKVDFVSEARGAMADF